MIDLLLAGGLFAGLWLAVCAIVCWDARRRVRWEQAKDRLKGYHYDA